MALVEVDRLAGQGIELRIEGGEDVEVGIVWTGRLRLPVIDEEFSLKVVEQSVLVGDCFGSPSSWGLGATVNDLNDQLEVEQESTPSAINGTKRHGQGEEERLRSMGARDVRTGNETLHGHAGDRGPQ